MSDIRDFAVAATREAGDLTLGYFKRGEFEVVVKEDGSPVTIADREAERLLRDRIGNAFPDDGIVGEEFGESRGTSGRIWILDPVDGTKSFVRGVPLYGTLVGVEVDGAARAGVAYLPALGEMVHASRGEGATWVTRIGTGAENTKPARVSGVSDPARAVLSTTSLGGFERAGLLEIHARLRAACGIDRGWGDCYGHVLVATGRAEVMADPLMNVWDCAALQPIVEEAGGVFTDFDGNPTHRGGSALSTNAALAEAIRRLI